MRKQFLILLIPILAIIIFFIFRQSAQSKTLQSSNDSAVLSVTNTIAPTEKLTEITQLPTTLTPTQTTTPQFSCNSIASAMKSQATKFMKAHQNKSIEVLSLMTAAELDDDAQNYAYLMGYDINSEPRLYTTAQMAYTTKSYSFGGISSAGQDTVVRGNDLCLLQVFEIRQSKAQEEFSEETVTRYLEFTVAPDTTSQISGYKDSKSGTKYSGFN